jgi:hypothetical protein
MAVTNGLSGLSPGNPQMHSGCIGSATFTELAFGLCGRMLDSRNLRSMADQCRTLASTRQTPEATRALLRMAESYDRQAVCRETLRDVR